LIAFVVGGVLQPDNLVDGHFKMDLKAEMFDTCFPISPNLLCGWVTKREVRWFFSFLGKREIWMVILKAETLKSCLRISIRPNTAYLASLLEQDNVVSFLQNRSCQHPTDTSTNHANLFLFHFLVFFSPPPIKLEFYALPQYDVCCG
jgi:hypothetical protein